MSTPNYSRTDLINWVSNLLQIQITKIESCGSGAVYCQILDSIYLDVPMARVNFEAHTVAEYISNFKILQECFKRHGISKQVDVPELVKCKMMANLGFLQWLRQYWETTHADLDYDAVGRRAARGGSAAQMRATPTLGVAAPNGAARRRAPMSSRPESALNSLQKQNEELQSVVIGLERERDFYFSKLRDIELLFQDRESAEESGKVEDPLLAQIQNILYSTEDGFEIPPQEGVENDFGMQQGEMVEETF